MQAIFTYLGSQHNKFRTARHCLNCQVYDTQFYALSWQAKLGDKLVYVARGVKGGISVVCSCVCVCVCVDGGGVFVQTCF